MSGVFISYAHADAQRVHPLAQSLRAGGFEVWIDLEEIHPASRFMDEVQPAIAEAEALVFFCSAHSLRSRYCTRELEAAVASGTVLIPVWLEDPRHGPDLPAMLDGLAGVPAHGESKERAARALDRALRTQSADQRPRRLLGIAARQWLQEGRPDDLLLTGRRLAEAARLFGPDGERAHGLGDLEAEFFERSRAANKTSAADLEQLRRNAALSGALQHMQANPRAALPYVAELATPPLDPKARRLVTQGLAMLGWTEGGEYEGHGALAVSSDMAYRAYTGYHQLGRPVAASMRLHKDAQGVPYADDWLRDAVVDLAYRPGTDELFVATEDERLGVARVSEADAETDTLRFRWFGASDRFRRELQAGLGKDWIGRWFIDEVPLGINSISFSPDGRWLAAAHADHRVRIFDADRRRQTRCLEGFPAGTWLRFSDSGRFLLSLGYRPRRSPLRWHRRRKGLFGDVQLSALIRTDDWQAVQLAPADWPDRPWLGRDRCVRLRDDDRWLFRAKEEEAFILSLANGAYHVVPHAGVRFAEFMPRARGLVTVGLDNVVRGWTWSDDEPDALIAKLDSGANVAEQCFAVQPPAPVTALCLLPNGKWLLVGTEAGVRTAFCDVFGSDETLLAYLHNASDGSNLPFPG